MYSTTVLYTIDTWLNGDLGEPKASTPDYLIINTELHPSIVVEQVISVLSSLHFSLNVASDRIFSLLGPCGCYG